MLGTLRKFSSSILAKIFLFIVAIPFVFWGMGDLFSVGNKNTIVKIGKEKISINEFINYIKYSPEIENNNLDKQIIRNLFNNFLGDKLISMEIERLGINLSDVSLARVIKNEKTFKKNKEFSRVEYEKFLLKNNTNAILFESKVSQQIKKEILFNFIGGGVVPPIFLINDDYNKINQIRNIRYINLNNAFAKNFNFTSEQIKDYYEKNINLFKKNYTTIKFIKLNTENLSDGNEFSDFFFKKIDEIDDLIVEGKKIDFISEKFNLTVIEKVSFDENGKNKNNEINKNFPESLIPDVLKNNEIKSTLLFEDENNYYLVEIDEVNNVQESLDDPNSKNKIISNLKNKVKRETMSNLISKINQNKFKKQDFDSYSLSEGVSIKNAKIDNQNDTKIFEQDLINQIYKFPENRVIIVADIGLTKNYLIHIDKIENKFIDKNSDDFDNYFNLSKVKMTSSLYDTYDAYLNKRYKIKINEKVLDGVQNYLR